MAASRSCSYLIVQMVMKKNRKRRIDPPTAQKAIISAFSRSFIGSISTAQQVHIGINNIVTSRPNRTMSRRIGCIVGLTHF